MRLPDPLRQRLRGSVIKMRGFHGHVDGVFDGALMGWVYVPGATRGVRVGLYVNGAMLVAAPANVLRADVAAMGLGDGHAGFVLPIQPETRRLIEINGGMAEVRVIGPRTHRVGQWQFDADRTRDGRALPSGLSPLQKRLYGDLQLLDTLLDQPPPPVRAPRASPPVQARLFDRRDYLDPGAELPEQMFGYAEYIRYRDRLDERFDPAHRPEDVAHFFKRYLGVYGAMRGGLRIPLSKAAIDYLNEPVVIGGQKPSLTRAAWAFMMDVPQILHSMDFANHEWVIWTVYWWSINQAQAIHCEDCLVPQEFVDLLRTVPEDWQDTPYGPSEFMLRVHAETPELAELPLTSDTARGDLTCALMLMALSRPDFLRYIPAENIDRALSERNGTTPLAEFCKDMGQPQPGLRRQAYADALRLQSFDLDTMRFLTFTAEGHRVEYAQLPPLPDTPPIDIQVIGPFQKASGLGQATRLSAAMLEQTGFEVNVVDFGLDNPAPEGFSRATAVSDYRPAKVNLFHLNSEAIPLAAAYQPDVFSGAYNIGYFFWELDSPGACHYMGMDMLDEIWVSTDFGVSVFQPHTGKPVTNVGMSYETLPDIKRRTARAYLEKIAKVKPDDFVFMVTFDSFSFVQRKNPLGVLEAFQTAFEGVGNVRLVIKTQNRTRVADPRQIEIWEAVDELLEGDNRIVLINETLQYEDLLRLKKGSDAYISLHRSEGWGFGMIEAMNLGVPVICTAYSGNMDFCTPDTCWLVDYKLTELGPQDYIFVRPGQKWAEPDTADAARQMRALYDDPAARAARAQAALDKVRTDFSEQAIGRRYGARMREIFATLKRGRDKMSTG